MPTKSRPHYAKHIPVGAPINVQTTRLVPDVFFSISVPTFPNKYRICGIAKRLRQLYF